ncbi:4Fe-4S binding protein [Ramlibacter sp. B156]|uniref:4Fe-4S binding protein n=1 Tax=Ramlibacter montanisoli TaxID=2732512 RepID=A0A849K589_9BURK|nr:4Fe-4S binding protein [Ramlibacter montanisoli]
MAPSRTADARSTRSAPVAVRASRCLHARLNASSCRACADACPTGALGMDAQGPVMREGCTGCGRCQAACPTGALAARGFEGLHVRGDAAVPRVIACLHGAEVQEAGTLRVPCLGGIADAQLLQLCVATPDHAVVLLDRGTCAGCDSGGAQHPAAATVQRVAGWLREAGIAEDRLPRLRRRMARTAAASIDPMQSQGRARRGFLDAIVRPADAPPAVPADDQSTPASRPSAPSPPWPRSTAAAWRRSCCIAWRSVRTARACASAPAPARRARSCVTAMSGRAWPVSPSTLPTASPAATAPRPARSRRCACGPARVPQEAGRC